TTTNNVQSHTPNRALADDDAQLEQLASTPLSTPQPVLTGHGRDQVLDFGAEMRAAASRAGFPASEQPPALSLRAHDRLRRHDGQMLAPAGTPPARQGPEQPVPGIKTGTRSGPSGTSQHRELMAQEQGLEHDVCRLATS